MFFEVLFYASIHRPVRGFHAIFCFLVYYLLLNLLLLFILLLLFFQFCLKKKVLFSL